MSKENVSTRILTDMTFSVSPKEKMILLNCRNLTTTRQY